MEASPKFGTLIANRYHILAKIGEGGFGTVYKVRDRQQHGKIVAIKEINMASLSAQEKIEVTDTFNREITFLSQLKHKNLPRIYDQFTDPEHWYIVMDYIEGQTLEELLTQSSKGKFSVKQVVQISIALCDVLSHLHDQRPSIIFRDVKPGNIMLTPWGHLYLIDFGIARRYQPGQARDTGPLGSPGYAAPEQYGSAQTTIQTDIYGTGATLQTLLTGKEPLEIRLQGLPPDRHIPWKLQALFIQMMDRDPAKRPGTMAEVKKSLTGLKITTFSSGWWSAYPIIYFGLMTITQSGFFDSPFLKLYLLFVLILLIGYCTYACIRSWRTTSAGLSAKSVLFIVGKQSASFLRFVLLPLTICVSLLYALLARPPAATIHAFFLWCIGILMIIAMLTFFIVWLKERYRLQRPQHNSAQVQMPPPLQQQKRP